VVDACFWRIRNAERQQYGHITIEHRLTTVSRACRRVSFCECLYAFLEFVIVSSFRFRIVFEILLPVSFIDIDDIYI
jgi:hypothetical protein